MEPLLYFVYKSNLKRKFCQIPVRACVHCASNLRNFLNSLCNWHSMSVNNILMQPLVATVAPNIMSEWSVVHWSPLRSLKKLMAMVGWLVGWLVMFELQNLQPRFWHKLQLARTFKTWKMPFHRRKFGLKLVSTFQNNVQFLTEKAIPLYKNTDSTAVK